MRSPAMKPGNAEAEPLAWRRRKDFRPQEILSAARQLIEEEGAKATSMAKIAKLAGVSEATVYKYYDNKQELVNHVLTDWATPFVERLTGELQHIADLRTQLTLIAVRFLRSMEETPKLHRVFYQELRWSDYRGTTLHAQNHTFAQTVVDAVERAKGQGKARADVDPVMIRDMLFGGLEHIAMRTSFIGRPLDIDAEATRFVDVLLGGVLMAPAAPAPIPDVDRLAGLVDRMETLLDARKEG
ncbi:TetR/AcrR family transcriptional regulator [Novosphingobium sp. P6W]|jgi:AcrR family transcriptional regulator|uniref:TetR/AcrR family transcriptional regulator n=1 Tax=Novosphingobium sp. P6W TaxID=1609758 RepID=UPI0005C5F1BB|nr:TetR/AcrR family transcriptional regulator [Novosphingobium sp. P6W]AXB78703.1 TetR/AcrR family transcriptional regulator [Novosphingobium sp. P6W]